MRGRDSRREFIFKMRIIQIIFTTIFFASVTQRSSRLRDRIFSFLLGVRLSALGSFYVQKHQRTFLLTTPSLCPRDDERS